MNFYWLWDNDRTFSEFHQVLLQGLLEKFFLRFLLLRIPISKIPPGVSYEIAPEVLFGIPPQVSSGFFFYKIPLEVPLVSSFRESFMNFIQNSCRVSSTSFFLFYQDFVVELFHEILI